MESLKYGWRPTKIGKQLCPKCSHTRQKNRADPCLSVSVADDGDGFVWNCHHCQWTGRTPPKNAYEHVPARVVALPKRKLTYAPPQAVSEPVKKWFEGRGISEAVIERNAIGYEQTWMPGCEEGTKTGAIMFPYRRTGEVVNIKYRTHDKRFRQERGCEKVYFGLDDVEGAQDIIIVEGEIDKLSLEEAGLKNVVSVPDGAPSKVKDEIPEEDRKFEYVWNCKEYFEGANRIILAVDNDDPGAALAEELARRYGKHRCWRVKWPDTYDIICKDANDVLLFHGAQTLRECIDAAEPYPIKSLIQADRYIEDVRRLWRGDTAKAFSTGWQPLDEFYKVRPGEFCVVTGFPGSGKSQFIDALCMNLAEKHNWRFGICSFENPPPNHLTKLIELRKRAPFWPGPSQRLSLEEVEDAVSWIKERFIFIRDDEESPTLDWILETAKAAVLRYGIRGLVVDPYNEMEHKRPPGHTETEYISELISKVKRFAQSHGVHVWFIAHPAKPQRFQGKVVAPTLFDISGSAHWVNKADIGIVVVRSYEKGHEHETKVLIDKVRFKEVGHVGGVLMEYLKLSGRYSVIEKLNPEEKKDDA